MANEQNLMPISEVNSRRTREQHSRDSRKAGIASGKARREKKAFKETLEAVLAMSIENGNIDDIDDIQNYAEMMGKNISVQEAMVLSMVQKALEGNVKAAEWIRDTAGQKPSDKVKLESEIDMTEKLKEVEAYIKGSGGNE